jgi:predicted MPP superfamily phosphohydrolase
MGWPLRMTLTIALVSLPVALYVALRLAAALSLSTSISAWRCRVLTIAALLPVYVFPLLMLARHLSGSGGTPPAEIHPVTFCEAAPLYLFWWGLIVILESFPYLLVMDLLLLPLIWMKRARKLWREPAALLRLTIVLLFMLYVPVRSAADTLTILHNEIQLTIEDLPEALDGVRIGLIGDLQFDEYTGEAKARRVRAILQEANVECVVFAGDLVTSGRAFVPLGIRSVCPPPVPGASIAVIGDHDYWSDRATISVAMRECGWDFLENDTTTLCLRGEPVHITGLTHVYSARLDSSAMDAALDAAPHSGFRLLVTHQPAMALVAAAERHGFDLVLAGHTHGGQIVFRPFGISVTPSRFETRYVSGLYHAGRTAVIVTNGIGFTLTPVRYQAPAEVTTITLRRYRTR